MGRIKGCGMAISEARNSMLVDVSTAEPIGRRWRRALGPDLDGYGFVLPATIIMTALIVYPFFLALWFSLSDGMMRSASCLNCRASRRKMGLLGRCWRGSRTIGMIRRRRIGMGYMWRKRSDA